RPGDPDIVSCSVFQGLLELVRETAIGCLCLGDFSPHDNGFRNASARASMSFHPTGSVSLNIPACPNHSGASLSLDRHDGLYWLLSFQRLRCEEIMRLESRIFSTCSTFLTIRLSEGLSKEEVQSYERRKGELQEQFQYLDVEIEGLKQQR